MSAITMPAYAPEVEQKISSKRIQVVDALRGFSLLGIILTHTTYSFLETTAQPTSYSESGNLSLIENAIKMAVQIFATGKFYSIFSFLFGLSFAIQLESAKVKGNPFVSRFIWRLIILLFIGYAHAQIYPRDILQTYALLGIILIFCINLSDKQLLILTFAFFSISVIATLLPLELKGLIYSFIKETNEYPISKVLGIGKFGFLITSGRLFVTIALFLLGLCAGRLNIFKGSPESFDLFHKIFIWSGFISLLTTAVVGVIGLKGLDSNPAINTVNLISIAIQKIALSAFYVSAIVKLFQLTIYSQFLKWLVPVGKMGLTVYITQSFFLALFYGFAFQFEAIRILGLPISVIITFLFFGFQIIFAHWWFTYFRLGPIEWLWRSLTYLKVEPIRND